MWQPFLRGTSTTAVKYNVLIFMGLIRHRCNMRVFILADIVWLLVLFSLSVIHEEGLYPINGLLMMMMIGIITIYSM
jgi:hypothetical protein